MAENQNKKTARGKTLYGLYFKNGKCIIDSSWLLPGNLLKPRLYISYSRLHSVMNNMVLDLITFSLEGWHLQNVIAVLLAAQGKNTSIINYSELFTACLLVVLLWFILSPWGILMRANKRWKSCTEIVFWTDCFSHKMLK